MYWLLVLLRVLLVILATWLTVRVFERSIPCGILLIALPALFALIAGWVGVLPAAAVTIAAQLFFTRPHCKSLRLPYLALPLVFGAVLVATRALRGVWTWR